MTRSHYKFCAAKRKDGRPCCNRVATLPSGVFVRGPFCHVHSKRSARAAAEVPHAR
jgi:hypothetical protein